MTTPDPKPLTRDQLALFLPNQDAIRRFERLFIQSGTLTPIQIELLLRLTEEVTINAGTAGAGVGAAIDNLSRIAGALEVLASTPHQSTDALERAIKDLVILNPIDRESQRAPSVDYLDFDENPRYVPKIRRVAWNPADDTLNIHHTGGVTQQIGAEQYVRFVNTSGANITNGQAIGINTVTNAIVKYLADGTLNSLGVVGIATQDIANGATGRVTVFGRVNQVNTTGAPVGETWNAGSLLYVSKAIPGALTIVKPTAPALSIPIGRVVTVHATDGVIFVRPTPEQQLFYGAFSKLADQVPSAANTAQALTWTNTETSNGVTIGSPTSRIVVANAGLYRFGISIQLTSSSASVKNVWTWFRKNGVDVPNSSLITSLDSATAIRVPSRNTFFSLQAGDYIEIMFASDSTAITVDNITATAFAPAAPAATLTVNQEQQ